MKGLSAIRFTSIFHSFSTKVKTVIIGGNKNPIPLNLPKNPSFLSSDHLNNHNYYRQKKK
jgi:hypothetical protein